MITSANELYEENERLRRQRNFEFAVVVSVVLHVLLGMFVWHNWAFIRHLADRTHRDDIAAVQPIRIERRIVVPRPAPKPKAVVKVEPVHTDPIVPQLPVPKALAEPPRPQVHQRAEVSHLALHAPPREQVPAGSPKRSTAYYDPAALAQLQNQFKQTISQAQAQSTAEQSSSTSVASSAVGMRHYAMTFSGIHDNLRHGEGTIDSCKVQSHGAYNYHYYCHYEYMYADGHVEEDTIPWPQIYPASNDPLMAQHSRVKILDPPSDYKPDRPLQPLLRQFFTHEEVAP